MIDRVGQHLGNYRLLRLLGRGGFADVYLGEHLHLQSQAALKMLRTSLRDDEAERFLSEARTLARLRHPSIVRVLDFTMEQGMPVLIMDYAPGGTARQRYPRGSRLPLPTVVTYVQQVASALQYAHNRDVIHRDVKPENLLLSADGEILLSDFGLALFSPSPDLLSTQEMAGTLPYIAPEQLRGKPGFASDQYALGIIAYEWLCGRRPFEGTQWELIQQHLSVAPPPLREQYPALPAAVEDVVKRALAKEPPQRFVSVQAFARALARAGQVSALDGDAQLTAPLGRPSRAVPLVDQPLSSSPTLPAAPIVFLVASPADNAFAARLQVDLEARGILVRHDHSSESPTDPADWEEALRQAIRAAHVVLVALSAHTHSSRIVRERLRIASLYERPLVFVWAAGEELAAVLPEAWKEKTTVVDLIDARESRYALALDELVACLLQEPFVTAHLRPTLVGSVGEAQAPRNPYKGLRAFTADDAVDFFGRDALIEGLAETLQGILTGEQAGTSDRRLLTVMGPSGSGKSSLVMAGLLPRLQRGTLPGSQTWVYLDPVVPGQHPIEALTLAFSSHFPARSLITIREDLEGDSARGLHLLALQLVQRPGARVVLLIDQFEEVFTHAISEDERQHFLDLLVTAATEPCGPVIILLTLRADYYDRLTPYPALGRLIEHQHHLVFPMEIQDLRAVIEQPAALPDVQLTFEGDLVGDLLFEVLGQIGALPLLQFTLDQLFERRKDHLLTYQAYAEIGGVKGALAKQAEETYAALPSEEHRKLARSLFLRLIDPGMTEQDTTRRRAALSELSLSTPEETELLQQVTASFLAARLLTTNEIAGTPTIEVSHEALIREWPRLSDWLREARDDVRLQQALSEDAAEWEQRGKPRDRLYRGSQLKEANAWARRNPPSKDEAAFLRASAARRMRSLASVIALVLLVLSTTGFAGWLFLHQSPNPTQVTNLNDDGPGSLRWSIANAPSGSTITFAQGLKGTIKLTSGDLTINRKLTIQGPGADRLAVSSGRTNSVIHVPRGASVTISYLSFKDSQFSPNRNGFIINEGALKVANSIFSGNSTEIGAGSAISNAGTLTISNSTFSGNSSGGGSGGALSNAGILTISNSTFSGNSSYEGNAIFNGGALTVSNSVFANNSPQFGAASGGAIFSAFGGAVTVSNSTFFDNSAAVGGAIGFYDDNGSGIFTPIVSDTSIITFCTIYGNNAKESGGGIFIPSNYRGKVKISNSIIAANHAPQSPDISGTLTSAGYNLIQDVSGATFGPSNRPSTDVSVDPSTNLKIDSQLSGPKPQTLALLLGSPAIDRIPADACHPTINGITITTDQRGVKRPQGAKCDIGAYEYAATG